MISLSLEEKGSLAFLHYYLFANYGKFGNQYSDKVSGSPFSLHKNKICHFSISKLGLIFSNLKNLRELIKQVFNVLWNIDFSFRLCFLKYVAL